MNHDSEVDFTASVAALLPRDLQERMARELKQIFNADRQRMRVLVSLCFGGYSPNLWRRAVLGVEVRRDDGYETHIVKIGDRAEVNPDADGWRACTADRQVASRILAPIQHVPELDDGRAAVLYRDAYTLFGLDRESSRPETLEKVTEWAVRDDRPDPLSVERAIAHIFTDLGRWFFFGAAENPSLSRAFYLERLRIARRAEDSDQPPLDPILGLWDADEHRRLLRRDAVWLICGRDKPDADPVREPARYLDPVDFVAWIMQSAHHEHLPPTLVGRSHGDLHGRNILVGVRRGEVEYPAVFDYGEMRPDNVLAWDFAKLEMELKVRLLTSLLNDGDVQANLLSRDRALPGQTHDGLPSLALERARRIAMFLAFEEWLHDLTSRIHSREQAETLAPLPPEYCRGVDKLDRLVAILLRIRKEAALWLGFEHHQRREKWRDEYYFALSVYGLLNVRWDYDLPQTECALIAAGVAAARMPRTPGLLRDCTQVHTGETTSYPSYRVPLAAMHGCWKAKDYERGKAIAERSVFAVERNSHGEVTKLTIRAEAVHAIPLLAEGALLEIECGQSRLVEDVLDNLRAPAKEFGDFETLGRLGRLFKDAGDKRWEQAGVSFEALPESTAIPLYVKALTVYAEAFRATNDYYTGINAATLALLTSEPVKAEEYAQRVAELCKQMQDISRDDRFWVFATQGEAHLILRNWQLGERFYRDALAELSPGQGGMANSSYKQLCRLWKALGPDVEGALSLFERSEFRISLTPLLGRVMVEA